MDKYNVMAQLESFSIYVEKLVVLHRLNFNINTQLSPYDYLGTLMSNYLT